nr:hypothetical protein GCM10020241_06160 [Streptoalloteichus tenebrarius]
MGDDAFGGASGAQRHRPRTQVAVTGVGLADAHAPVDAVLQLEVVAGEGVRDLVPAGERDVVAHDVEPAPQRRHLDRAVADLGAEPVPDGAVAALVGLGDHSVVRGGRRVQLGGAGGADDLVNPGHRFAG